MAKQLGLFEDLVTLMEGDTAKDNYRRLVLVMGNLSMYVEAEKETFRKFARRRLLTHFAQ